MRKAATVKIVRLVKRRADLTPAQFKEYWLTRHALHERRAIETTPLQKVVASIATGEVALGGTEPPFDGMVALYFRSLEDARATFSGPGTAAMREDAKNFVDPRSSPQIFADEYLVSEKDGAPGTIRRSGQLKTIRTISRRRDLTHAQFKDYWLNQHSRLEREVIETTSMQRIIASFALPENPAAPEFDGLAELYFENVEDIRAMFAGPVPAMMRKDEQNFVQMNAPAVRLVAEEYLIGDKDLTGTGK
ncbi:MAG TPA: EthD domain-containing protein [Burkholderiales bacterium]|jgi:uncharacterized protein (TIGR02118 family)|nr:EthD domain-containing protein [Burkholderiales bacterium]